MGTVHYSSSVSESNPSIRQDEATLIEATRAGDHSAFTTLCDRHSKRVFNMIYRVTKNREDAEDALQDCLMKAFLHLHQFDGRSSFSTWLTRIGINSGLMILRKKRGCKEIPMETSYDGGETWTNHEIADSSFNPEEEYATRERSLRLSTAVRRLPNTLRAVVEIRQTEELSMREIAAKLEISVPAAKSRLLRARGTLRTLATLSLSSESGSRNVYTSR